MSFDEQPPNTLQMMKEGDYAEYFDMQLNSRIESKLIRVKTLSINMHKGKVVRSRGPFTNGQKGFTDDSYKAKCVTLSWDETPRTLADLAESLKELADRVEMFAKE